MKPDWILIANATHARLMQREPGCPLVALRVWEHPASRLHSSELGDDRAGREANDRTYGGGASFAPRLDEHRKQALAFAHELAVQLEIAARENRFQGLTIYASSPFLGEVKAALGDVTRKLLQGTHEADYTSLGLAEIEERLGLASGQAH